MVGRTRDPQLNVLVDGPADAPVLLLVHGFGGSLRSYDPVAALLTERFRVVRADLRGHGRTGGHTGLDAAAQAEALAAAVGNLTGITAVGHSFGADVVLELATRTKAVERSSSSDRHRTTATPLSRQGTGCSPHQR
ncbi:hypothetical protein GCM10022222_24070 [Amycolatopsis ultiminotia]|uniref:AB hydrolase-1 domain-containing protein n=1 Tax=Amycolatopsis ultiminotia TaxID=543629 RepID=A0ABP6VVU2_9PSEU